ncbi:MAG: PAS domain S-box protein [Coleofasciculus sp. S288]|nr:PAS domain S-box protein [Coleofasciculus sp. S288]
MPLEESTNLANQRLFPAFVEHMPAAVAMLDRNLCYLLVSRRWLTDYGLENQDLIGQSHHEIFPLFRTQNGRAGEWESGGIGERDNHASFPCHPLKRWQEIYASCLAGETRQGDSDYFIKPDGLRQKVKWEIQPWRMGSGEIGGILIFTEFQESYSLTEMSQWDGEDGYRCILETAADGIQETASLTRMIEQLQQEVAERKQAQSLLQKSEERYRSLIAAMAEGIILQDVTGTIQTYNAAAKRMLGLSAEQLMGRKAIDSRWRAITKEGEPFSLEEHPLRVTLRTGQPLSDVIMGIHKSDGSLTWLSVNSQPLFYPNEAIPYAAVASLIDVTKRKQIGEALCESEERFRTTFEQAAVGITHTSSEDKFVRVNQKFCEIAGYTREELLERTFRDITHPDDLEVDLEYVRSLLSGELDTYSREKRYIRQDGQAIWVHITASLVRTYRGTPKYFLRVVQDISDRKAAEAALRQSEAQLREQAQREALLNRLSTQIRNSLELNTILETTAQEIRHILQIDRCQFAWYRPDETQPYWEVVEEARNPDCPDHKGCYPVEAVGPLAERVLNMEILRVDDIEAVGHPSFRQFIRSLGHRSVLVLPMQTPSGVIGIINCTHDREVRPWSDSEVELLQAVTDQLLIAIKQAELYDASRKATQQAQEQATQLQQTLRKLQRTQAQLIQSEKMSSLGQLVAGVAHEINNPVNFIYGNLIYAQEYYQNLLSLMQLYRTAYPNPPAVIRERIDAIDLDFLMTDFARLQNSMRLGAERIREIVRSLQTFSRVDESGRKLADIHEGIESTLMILHNRLKAKPNQPAISVIKEYGQIPPVECYPGQLNQVFLNLLTNAIDALEEKFTGKESETATPSPPTITISTEVVSGQSSVLSSREQRTIECVVIRIADNGCGMTQQTLQQLFDPFFTTKPVGKGTGLGLAISYQIVVEKHGGQLWCNSAPGQGAEFVIEIPLRHQDSVSEVVIMNCVHQDA